MAKDGGSGILMDRHGTARPETGRTVEGKNTLEGEKAAGRTQGARDLIAQGQHQFLGRPSRQGSDEAAAPVPNTQLGMRISHETGPLPHAYFPRQYREENHESRRSRF